ncbi:hypothetical protein ACRALDRAFT_2104083 [Sodiomyces alcalophilus JCM 7366]|uniref:uncharacterized protein n=1 Tax=Sodiomyces alcalophilus JCM 7366 TaxID=591952 RepID=UPI0039B51AB9
MVDCKACSRSFGSRESLRQHVSSKHPSIYCERCRRFFTSAEAKQQHLANSSQHNICDWCSHKPDFPSNDELNEHFEEEHNMCHDCRRFFSSPSALENHGITHAEKNTRCYGCERYFVSNSAMILHLEDGNCESGVDWDFINEKAFGFYSRHEFLCTDDQDFDFQCPTCETLFRWISGMLQHMESYVPCRGQNRGWDIMLDFLRYLSLEI